MSRIQSFIVGMKSSVQLTTGGDSSYRNLSMLVALIFVLLLISVAGIALFGFGGVSPNAGFYEIQTADEQYVQYLHDNNRYVLAQETLPISQSGPDIIIEDDGTIVYDEHADHSRYAYNDLSRTLIEENSERLAENGDTQIFVSMETVRTAEYEHTSMTAVTESSKPGELFLPTLTTESGYVFLVLFITVFLLTMFSEHIFSLKNSGLSMLIHTSTTNTVWYLYGTIVAHALPAVIAVLLLSTIVRPSALEIIPPLMFFFMSFLITSTIAILSRSKRQMGMIMSIFIITLLLYVILPIVFIGTHPAAILSPFTPFISSIYGISYTAIPTLFSMLIPVAVTGIILYFTLPIYKTGWSVLRANDMFKSAIKSRGKTYISHALFITALIPIAFVVQLAAVGGAMILPTSISLILIFIVVSVSEELIKSAPVINLIGELQTRDVIIRGGISGIVFYLVEMAFVIVQVVGLVYFGSMGGTEQLAAQSGNLPIWAGLVYPLILHTVTATVTIYGMKYSVRGYIVALLCSVSIHTVYNLSVIGMF